MISKITDGREERNRLINIFYKQYESKLGYICYYGNIWNIGTEQVQFESFETYVINTTHL